MYIVTAYVVYLVIGLTVTVWVAKSLSRGGRVFLVDAFHGNAELADSVNHLLVVGFYLLNLGYLALVLRTSQTPADPRQAIELVADKVGAALLVLGGLHFFNLLVLNRLRRHKHERAAPSPTLPRAHSFGKVLD
jgi:hypothetical protein